MTEFPASGEAAPYYFTYISQVAGADIVAVLETQGQDAPLLLSRISEEQSLHRYAPDKWSIRQVLSHITDTERVLVSRAFWFARGFDTPLPSFDQDTSVVAAEADRVSWASHLDEFRTVRQATLSFFRNLPPEAWTRSGIASGNPFTVRALAWIIAGHFIHHRVILEQRYL
ncbi:MAG: DinB family protein [Acidobacteriia bacterium]|nr:DinB family protein [Terriglobia bacterium]